MTAQTESPKGPIRAAMFVVLLGLGGCACFSGDGGYGFVKSMARKRIGKEVKWIKSDADADSVEASVKGLLAHSLTVEDAVQIALLNNRGLQAMYGELGIAEADLVQADTCRATLPIAPTGIKMEVDSRSRSERDICDATTVKLLLVKIES